MPLIDKKIPLKEFKETCILHKFTPKGFVLLYGHGEHSYMYRIIMDGKNATKALRYAYISLFGTIDEDEVSEVQVDLDGSKRLKMPITVNVAFSPNVDNWDMDLKTMTRKHNWDI
jgi:hypothetical protein